MSKRTRSLKELLAQAQQASPNDRIELRDAVAEHGTAAIDAMVPFARDNAMQHFAVQVIGRVGHFGNRDAAINGLGAILSQAPSLAHEIYFQISQLKSPDRPSATRASASEPAPNRMDRSALSPAARAALSPADEIVVEDFVHQSDGVRISVHILDVGAEDVRRTLAKGEFGGGPRTYHLANVARELRRNDRIDELVSLPNLAGRIQPHVFQMEAALRVLRDLRPAALLADEVGLGKTIEAGLVLKELIARKEVKTALVIVPKSLVPQWQDEMRQKFGLAFVSTDDERGALRSRDRVITTLGVFSRGAHEALARRWDIVIVDEAHLLANPQSKRRRAVSELQRKWLLLLTATPLSNRLTDVYSLVDLLTPGRFGSEYRFRTTYAADGRLRRVYPTRAAELRRIVSEVMVRNRRAETDVPFSSRFVETRSVHPTPAEARLHDGVIDYLRHIYRRGELVAKRGLLLREALSMQQSLSSSPQALQTSLTGRASRRPDERLLLEPLIALAATITQGSKEQLLMRVLAETGKQSAVIYCLRRETVHHLVATLKRSGVGAEAFHGQLSSRERVDRIARFTAGELQYLISTDAGAEGLNLHRSCNLLFNYDLHWNPMKLEQRIGRVHRFGQIRDVTVINLSLEDTIDHYVLAVLDEKLRLFHQVIGAVEDVLAEFEDGEENLETRIMEIILRSRTKLDIKRQLDELANDVHSKMRRLELAQEFTAGVLG